MKVCEVCGMINQDHSLLCIECGAPLTSGEPAEKEAAVDSTEAVEEEAPKIGGLKLSLANDEPAEKVSNTGDYSAKASYASEGINSFSNNSGAGAGSSYGSYNPGPSGNSYSQGSYSQAPAGGFNQGPVGGSSFGNDFGSSRSSVMMEAPSGGNGRNLTIIAIIGVIFAAVMFFMIKDAGGIGGSTTASNTPRQAMESFIDDMNNLSTDKVEEYTYKSKVVSVRAEMEREYEGMRTDMAEMPGVKYSVSLISYNETDCKNSEKSYYKRELKDKNCADKKINDVKKINITIKVELNYKGETYSENQSTDGIAYLTEGKWYLYMK